MKLNLRAFDDKDVVFVGAGKGRSMSGVQTFLEQHAKLKSFTGVDKQAGDNPLEFLKGYDPSTTIFIKNEGIPGDSMPVPYITALQLFFRIAHENQLMTIGITGTKGKSTTTALTTAILGHSGANVVLAGNIGVSPLPALSTATPDTIFVLELSSYQLADLQVSPHISACVNLYNDHTDWHGSLENYWEAKHNIMRYAGPGDVFIYNPVFATLRDWAASAQCHTIAIDPTEKFDLTGAQLFGDHNALNALVAREIARQFEIPDYISMEAILQFIPLRHRLQTVAVKQGVTYIDDGIGMTPESTIASITAVAKEIGPVGCLMLGGQDRNYEFAELMKVVAAHKIPYIVLFPDTEEKMRAAMPDEYQPELFETRSMHDAIEFASKHVPEGSVVLLSTAAPSYSVWRDFEEKGDLFQTEVMLLR